MKAFQVFTAVVLLSLSSPVFAEDVTPTMEDAFLSKFKASIANKDYEQFRELFYESENKGMWMQLQTRAPYETIFSDSPRTYSFEPPWAGRTRSTQARTPSTWYGIPTVTPIFHNNNWWEKLRVAKELIITFPMKVPYTNENVVHIPLIVKNGKLFAVHESFIIN